MLKKINYKASLIAFAIDLIGTMLVGVLILAPVIMYLGQSFGASAMHGFLESMEARFAGLSIGASFSLLGGYLVVRMAKDKWLFSALFYCLLLAISGVLQILLFSTPALMVFDLLSFLFGFVFVFLGVFIGRKLG